MNRVEGTRNGAIEVLETLLLVIFCLSGCSKGVLVNTSNEWPGGHSMACPITLAETIAVSA